MGREPTSAAEKITRAKQRYDALHEQAHDRDPLELGCRIFNQEGTEYGLSRGKCGVYMGEAGRSDVISVMWSDTHITKPKVRGVGWSAELSAWQIGRSGDKPAEEPAVLPPLETDETLVEVAVVLTGPPWDVVREGIGGPNNVKTRGLPAFRVQRRDLPVLVAPAYRLLSHPGQFLLDPNAVVPLLGVVRGDYREFLLRFLQMWKRLLSGHADSGHYTFTVVVPDPYYKDLK